MTASTGCTLRPMTTTTSTESDWNLSAEDLFECDCCGTGRLSEPGSLACSVCNDDLDCWTCIVCVEQYHAEETALLVEGPDGESYCPECLPG